jgi:hypothetical protein
MKSAPVVRQCVAAADDDVHLLRPIGHRQLDLAQLGLHRRQAGGEAGGDHRHRDATACQLLHRGRHHRVIDADRTHLQVGQPQRFQQVGPQRVARLGAQALHAAGRVVAGQGGEVHALDGLHQPGRLVILLHRAPRGQAGGAAHDGGLVDPHGAHAREVEFGAGVEPHVGVALGLRKERHSAEIQGLRPRVAAVVCPGRAPQRVSPAGGCRRASLESFGNCTRSRS